MADRLQRIPAKDEGQQLWPCQIPAHDHRLAIGQSCPQLADGQRLHLLAEGEAGINWLDLFLDEAIQLLLELQQLFAHLLSSFLLNSLEGQGLWALRPSDSIGSRNGRAREAVG